MAVRLTVVEKDGARPLSKRVFLDAFTSDRPIRWIEEKLEEHGVAKVIPDRATLDAAVRGFARDETAERHLVNPGGRIAREVAAFDPGDVTAATPGMLAEPPEIPCDKAVEQLVRRRTTKDEPSGGEAAG